MKGFTLKDWAGRAGTLLVLIAIAAPAMVLPAMAQEPVQGQETPQEEGPETQGQVKTPTQASGPTQELPLWEMGLGLGAIGFRDYRGSDTTHAYPVPVGYFIYRGKYLQTDRSGLKTKLPIGNRLELNLSLNATTPV